jgi:hypothetical protein
VAAHSERRNVRRGIRRRDALFAHASRARRPASRETGEGGTGSYSPFEHGPSGMGQLVVAHVAWQTSSGAGRFRPMLGSA